jgi:hypothetical protein
MALFVRTKEVKRAFEDFKAELETFEVDASQMRLARRFYRSGPVRYEIREHGNVVLPWYVIKNEQPPVLASAVSSRDALKTLTFATEVLRFVKRRCPR